MQTLQSSGWLARVSVALITAALVVLGFFFLTVALIAGTLVATVVGARLWWTLRKLKRMQTDSDATSAVDKARDLHGEYRVVEREATVVRLPPTTER